MSSLHQDVAPVVSRNGDMFFYSSYWRTWSRVLAPEGALDVGIVEVDLTGNWERVRTINIRAHRTARKSGDLLVRELPSEALEAMKKHMPGQAILDVLLHEDLLPQIDWYKYRKVCNGGAAFGNIIA
jgi:hypothetical protein